MHALANVLNKGRGGVEINTRRAVQLFEMAIMGRRRIISMEELALLYRYGGEGVEVDVWKSIEYYEMIIHETGTSISLVSLAKFLLSGEGCNDIPRAKRLLEHASLDGNTDAYWELACLLRDGNECVKMDHWRAVELFEKIIEEDGDDSLDAKMQIALLFTGNSHQLQEDRKRGIRLYEEILMESNSTAMHNLVRLLRAEINDGYNQAEEKERAIALCERAIVEHNDIEGTILLAQILEDDDNGLLINEARIIFLLEQATEMDHGLARYKLAVRLCDSDLHLPLDIQQGIKLFELAIEKDTDPCAMVRLAIILKAGVHGVQRDVPRAVNLCETAITVGLNFDKLQLEQLGLWNNYLQKMRNTSLNGKRERKAAIWAMQCLAEILLLHDTQRRNIDRALTLLEHALRDPGATNAFSILQFNVNMLQLVIETADSANSEWDRAVRMLENVTGKTGNTVVMQLLGNYMLSGTFGVSQNLKLGLNLYARAVFGGDVEAMLNLGKVYWIGVNGVEVDMFKAFDLFARAVACENSSNVVVITAVINLAQLYLNIKKNEKMSNASSVKGRKIRESGQ